MTQKQKEEYVAKIWTDPRHAAAFEGPVKLYDVIRKDGNYKIGLGTIRKILSKKETYSFQRPARSNFPRNRVIVSGINAQWDGALASMENVSKYNNEIEFLLVLIDIFSIYLVVRPLKDEKSVTVMEALKSIFKGNNRRPKTIRFDQGG